MRRDSANGMQLKAVLAAVSVADNTAQVGSIIDIQGFTRLTYAIQIGAVADADATFAVLLEESNNADMSGANTVADGDMISETVGVAPLTAAGFKFDSDGQVRKLGYRGSKRYTRLTVTPANNAGAAAFAAMAILDGANNAPVVQAVS
ncbi:hypothetical protein AB7M45_007815 [Bradyrhizobium elkanii]|uniref:hypothetical protein n=1 Tax=Bradyrhizobium elkanii TaxID=29448 RepID=UPI000915A9DD|nr:hypothetical protein [Bradyrhizobium elkanii]MCW2195042.1 hypothetical protein [Bradyrhizobium elkanii]NWL67263.1 hypothetical protein [Bradyrhizobium elkanii]OIM91630.1 hypothetical protein BLN97_26525 [Bradyrhizobium elkanii]